MTGRRLHPDDLSAAKGFPTAARRQRQLLIGVSAVCPTATSAISATAPRLPGPGEPPQDVGVEWDVTADVGSTRASKHAKMLTEARNAELEAAKARIEHNALHDSLTGLPNRRYLDEILAEHVDAARREGERAGAAPYRSRPLQADQRHARPCRGRRHAGACRQGAEGQCCAQGDFVARIGGDEFVVLCMADGSTSSRNGCSPRSPTASSSRCASRSPYEGHECRFGVSIGIASERRASTDPRRLLVNADIALYRAKSRGRNRYEFFTEALQAEIVAHQADRRRDPGGLERNEFVAYYQPQFDAAHPGDRRRRGAGALGAPDRGHPGARLPS